MDKLAVRLSLGVRAQLDGLAPAASLAMADASVTVEANPPELIRLTPPAQW